MERLYSAFILKVQSIFPEKEIELDAISGYEKLNNSKLDFNACQSALKLMIDARFIGRTRDGEEIPHPLDLWNFGQFIGILFARKHFEQETANFIDQSMIRGCFCVFLMKYAEFRKETNQIALSVREIEPTEFGKFSLSRHGGLREKNLSLYPTDINLRSRIRTDADGDDRRSNDLGPRF